MRTFPVSRRRLWQLAFDALLIVGAWRLTFFLTFDKQTPIYYRHLLSWQGITVVVGIKLAVFVLFGFYNRCGATSRRETCGALRAASSWPVSPPTSCSMRSR